MGKAAVVFFTLASVVPCALGFVSIQKSRSPSCLTSLFMANEKDLVRWAKASRRASPDDRVVELKKPLGIVLNEDDEGNVYVETVAPRGNAARSGLVKEGDILTMCSATFGDQLWSCRGAGLSRILSAIRIRSGPTVTLVLDNPSGYVRKNKLTAREIEVRENAKIKAQKKKDELLSELEESEKKLKKGKFLGLF